MSDTTATDFFPVLATIAFLAQLGVLAVSDACTLKLPLGVNLSFCASGLLMSGEAFGTPVADRYQGAILGYLALQIVAILYLWLRKQTGMGGGDPILLAGIGAWLGWQVLPETVALASFLGLAMTLGLRITGQFKGPWPTLRLPLGTLLLISAIACVITGYAGGGFRIVS
ncbi:A24 family peptidase [Novosphingobium sp. MW5]|nr:A24 family peptidase [Novosphingobium sp. MW5]